MQLDTSVEYSDIIQSQKTSFKNVITVWIFSIDPPGKIDEQFMKYFFQEIKIAFTGIIFFDMIHLQCSPGLNRRVYITEIPFIGR